MQLLVSLLSFMLISCANANQWQRTQSVIKKDPAIESRVQSLLSSMTLKEKVGQIIQAEIKHISPDDLKDFPIGSILNGGGSFPGNNKFAKISDWVDLADSFYNASIKTGKKIPIIWGTDAVHGHNNVIGATLFPHNIGLGAANNPELIEEIANATAKEVLATGIDWIFAPTVAVARNDRWGRTYESYSEDPAIVKKYSEKIIQGIQGKNQEILGEDHLLGTAKHFLGDGGTENGTDQGNNTASEEELIRIHAQGYFSALNAGAQTVMASFNSWKGVKIHGHKYLLTDVLKNKMGFDGFVIGDWNGHGQIPGCRNDSCPQAINAGVDMFMAPEDWKKLFWNTLGQVKSGEISMDRLNDAVTRILRVKIRYGIFELGAPSTRKHAGYVRMVGSKKHREIARKAVRQSLVLLKNKNSLLPLSPKSKVLVTGSGANNIGKQSGGWTLSWQGTGNTNADFPGGTSIFDGINTYLSQNGGQAVLQNSENPNFKPDVAIVVIGENPYAEGQGDIPNLHYASRFGGDIQILKDLKAKAIPTVTIFITGRPLWTNPEINASDAFVVAWLPGSEGIGVSDVLFRNAKGEVNFDFKGKLSFSWPRFADQDQLNRGPQNYNPLFPYGFGLTYSDTDSLGDNLSETPYSSGSGPGDLDELIIFSGRPFSPFSVFIGDENQTPQLIPAGVGPNRNQTITAIAVDKDIQEDARKIQFKATKYGQYFFESSKPMDLTSFSKGSLSFDWRRDSLAQGLLKLKIEGIELDITNAFNSQTAGQWRRTQIPLECFVKKGLDLRSIERAYGIVSSGDSTLSIANIKWHKNAKSVQKCEL